MLQLLDKSTSIFASSISQNKYTDYILLHLSCDININSRDVKRTIMNTIKNQVQLIGNVGKDVEIRKIPNGSSVANFTLATNDYYKNNKGEKVQDTQWHNIVMWGKQAELASEMLKKGSSVLVQGKLMYRSYEDAEGNKKYICEIKASAFNKMSAAEKTAEAVVRCDGMFDVTELTTYLMRDGNFCFVLHSCSLSLVYHLFVYLSVSNFVYLQKPCTGKQI